MLKLVLFMPHLSRTLSRSIPGFRTGSLERLGTSEREEMLHLQSMQDFLHEPGEGKGGWIALHVFRIRELNVTSPVFDRAATRGDDVANPIGVESVGERNDEFVARSKRHDRSSIGHVALAANVIEHGKGRNAAGELARHGIDDPAVDSCHRCWNRHAGPSCTRPEWHAIKREAIGG